MNALNAAKQIPPKRRNKQNAHESQPAARALEQMMTSLCEKKQVATGLSHVTLNEIHKCKQCCSTQQYRTAIASIAIHRWCLPGTSRCHGMFLRSIRPGQKHGKTHL